MIERVFVGMGSNLGDREAHLAAAYDELGVFAGVRTVVLSGIWETAPVGPPGQGPYLNAVLELGAELEPATLLAELLRVEVLRGRRRSSRRNEARPLDLDLLLHGTRSVAEPGLVVPHPRLHERGFVLAPLAELAGDVIHPELDVSIAELAAKLRGGEHWDPEEVRPWRSSPSASHR